MTHYDAVVVGAGPAGSIAALDLARGGASVALIDQASLPRYKTCGGGILSRAFRLLPQSVSQVIERSFNSIQLNFLDRDLQFVTTRDTPIVYMTMRADLDHLLAQQAVAAGADLLQTCEVTALRHSNDAVELTTTTGPIHAGALIAADGAKSKLASLAGWPDSRHLIPALEYEIKVPETDFSRLNAARFDFGVISAGYAWVFPKRHHLSVGILTTHRRGINLHHELEKYLKLLGINKIISIQKHGYVIPISPRKEKLAKGPIFLTGDAAGLADPITAEGISHAITSGQLAAQSILTQSTIPTAAEYYQSLLETHLLPELKAARAIANILYHWPRLRNFSFRLNGQKLCEFVTDIVMGNKTYRSALHKPSSYLEVLGIWR